MKKATLSIAAALTLAALLPAEADAQFTVWKGGEDVYSMVTGRADSVTFYYYYNTPDKTVGGTVPTRADAVDLGLPSGTLWAPYNVGATKPGETGVYFAWGETKSGKTNTDGKMYYGYDNYKWTTDGGTTFTKYTKTDGKTTLDYEDDAASANWGGDWQMPTQTQMEELLANCTVEWKDAGAYAEGSIAGYLLTSKKNGKTLYLPAASGYWDANFAFVGKRGFYWSASVVSTQVASARIIYFTDISEPHKDADLRCHGLPVRPVCPAE